jgi:hypothetical protein
MRILHKLRRHLGTLAALPGWLASPAHRYRHARLLHSLRVTVAVLASIALTTGINVPHGLWATVSLLVVMGGLQHQGNIRKKAVDRSLGTLFGALLGLVLIAQYTLIGSAALNYLLLAVIAGVCGYHAIGRGGYIALLTAITLFIVAGHGEASMQDALWRTADVVIGIALALAFSFVLPFYATYSWRHGLARNMRGVAEICRRILAGAPLDAQEQLRRHAELGKRLVELRSLMPSVAKETGVSVAALEAIQTRHRAVLSGLEMLVSGGCACTPDRPPAHGGTAGHAPTGTPAATPPAQVRGDLLELRRAALLTARALRAGDLSQLPAGPSRQVSIPAATAGAARPETGVPYRSAALEAAAGDSRSGPEGPHWLCRQILQQMEGLDHGLEQGSALFEV